MASSRSAPVPRLANNERPESSSTRTYPRLARSLTGSTRLTVALALSCGNTDECAPGAFRGIGGVLRAGGITDVNAAVQVKRWKRNVQARTVRDLRGSLRVHEQGIIITTSSFSSGARREAQESGKTRISLIDGKHLLNLLTGDSFQWIIYQNSFSGHCGPPC